ncbi:MAG TPA: SpoIVB peptidase [Firmicutes bacterium]|nr:SpoIVB peptidase [Candidatus Fermentithermobacillaceae bacterium]
MPKERAKRIAGIIICVFIALITASNPFRLAYSFPEAITLLTGQDFVVDTGYPVVSVSSGESGKGSSWPWGDLTTRLTMDTEKPGEYSIVFKLFGIIPLRRVSLTVAEPIMVVPGGHSIGVVLRSSGLVITGLCPVLTIDGKEVWPAKSAGLEPGDVILAVGDRRVSTKEELAILVDEAGRAGEWVDLLVEKTDGSAVHRALMPVRNKYGGFNIGLYVKDALAGVGTLTFYEPGTGLYAALGHVISEGDSRRPVTMKQGHIVRATVTGVQPSKKGQPGEVLGTFVEGQDVIGNILKNGDCGISGILSALPENPYYPEPIPLGLESKLKTGPAEVLTTVNGTTIERFSIEIQQVFGSSSPSSKGFLIKITDPRLLSLTGGIVQGMSGSPIIQDGYLVGAITHVLVNDPTRGYGTFAEWMARDSHMMSSPAARADFEAAAATAAKR